MKYHIIGDGWSNVIWDEEEDRILDLDEVVEILNRKEKDGNRKRKI